MLGILDNLNVESSALILLPERDWNVEKSVSNIPDVKTLRTTCLNVIDILNYETLILPVKALESIEQFLG